jgi:Cu/Ag efflux pump CusA
VRSVTQLCCAAFHFSTDGLLFQHVMGFGVSGVVWVGHIALFGIAAETGFVVAICSHEALNRHIAGGELTQEGVETAVIEAAV